MYRLELIVGIEAHVQLATRSKAFCSCPAYPPTGGPPEGRMKGAPLLHHRHEEPPCTLPWLQQQQEQQQQQQQQESLCLLPNSRVCPICLGDGGALPSPNRKAVELALAAAMLMNCRTGITPPAAAAAAAVCCCCCCCCCKWGPYGSIISCLGRWLLSLSFSFRDSPTVSFLLLLLLLLLLHAADILRFDRKCYVYPDLAKRYQITQTFS